jgi:hypothetical protein
MPQNPQPHHHPASSTAVSSKPLHKGEEKFEAEFKPYFKGMSGRSVFAAAQVAGGVLALVKPPYCRTRLVFTCDLAYIPEGGNYRWGPLLVISRADVHAKFSLENSQIFGRFTRLTNGHERGYFPFVRQVMGTLGRLSEQLIEAVSVPAGFLTIFSAYCEHPRGVWFYPTPQRRSTPIAVSHSSLAALPRRQITDEAEASRQSLHSEAMKLQIQAPNDCMHTPTYRFEPSMLHHAMSTGDAELTRSLIQHSRDPNLINALGNTVLHEAVLLDAGLETFRSLLEAGANLLSPDARGRNALQLAIKEHKVDAVRNLVEAGAKPLDIFGSLCEAKDFCRLYNAPDCEAVICAQAAKTAAQEAILGIANDLLP